MFYPLFLIIFATIKIKLIKHYLYPLFLKLLIQQLFYISVANIIFRYGVNQGNTLYHQIVSNIPVFII